jgi:hypothetical protein
LLQEEKEGYSDSGVVLLAKLLTDQPTNMGSSGLAVENIRFTSALESQIPTLSSVRFGPK